MRKILLVSGLAVLTVLQAAVAWNARLFWKGKAVVNEPEAKTRILLRANAVYPWNAASYFELGKVYFERGAEALGDPAVRDRYFDLSVEAFLRSLRLNPASPEAHFHLAQTLLYMSYMSLPAPLGYFEEYLKAAALTGHSSQIYFEVGKVMLSRWETLSPGEKDFAADILKKTLAGKDQDRLLDLLEIWSLDCRDHALLERILPDDGPSLRACARFLGERSTSLEARQLALARAEKLDFLRAKSQLDKGRQAAEALRATAAKVHYEDAVWVLRSIKFYQDLVGRELFDPKEFDQVRKTARRLQAMNGIERTRSIADKDGVIAAYFALEDDPTALGEFEDFVRGKGLLGEGSTAVSSFRELPTLAFRLALDFRRKRYEDIVGAGDLLASSPLTIPPSHRAFYVRILGLIGESDLELHDVPDAEKHFRMALELEPENLDILLGLERCDERLNAGAKPDEIRQAIDRLTTPATIDLGGRTLEKGESFKVDLVTDGRPRTLRLGFTPAVPGGHPLVSIFMNGRVAWENNGDTGSAAFVVSPLTGVNSLEITAVGGAINLVGITQDIFAGR
jgi:tetratricopeptide (TPR) repeat protein